MSTDSATRALHLADLITELNGTHSRYGLREASPSFGAHPFSGFCGFMSILSSMRYCLGPLDSFGNLYAALAFMPFGLFFDFMDGKVARWRGKSSLMGQELDSLADLVCWSTISGFVQFAKSVQYSAGEEEQ